VQKRDSLALGADAGRFVDELDRGGATTVECGVEVVNDKADVVDAWASPSEEAPHRRIRGIRCEELDEGVASGQANDAGAVGVFHRDLRQSQHIAVERERLAKRTNGDTDMCDASAAASVIFHVELALRCENDETNLSSVGTSWNPALWRTGMSNSVAVTDATFVTEIEEHKGLAVVDFWAAWCGPCRMIAPILDQLASEYGGKAKVAKVDVDTNQQTAMRFNVRSIPSILFFKDGKHVDTVVGAVPKSHLERKFAEHA
jgi:thioredoxin 1